MNIQANLELHDGPLEDQSIIYAVCFLVASAMKVKRLSVSALLFYWAPLNVCLCWK